MCVCVHAGTYTDMVDVCVLQAKVCVCVCAGTYTDMVDVCVLQAKVCVCVCVCVQVLTLTWLMSVYCRPKCVYVCVCRYLH